ncbi:MAG: hypothetical protein AAF982_08480 [Pseudomonadota bacterium]
MFETVTPKCCTPRIRSATELSWADEGIAVESDNASALTAGLRVFLIGLDVTGFTFQFRLSDDLPDNEMSNTLPDRGKKHLASAALVGVYVLLFALGG